ncbi:MAG: TIM-barrel domain-containing protein [Marmoricola sp.]
MGTRKVRRSGRQLLLTALTFALVAAVVGPVEAGSRTVRPVTKTHNGVVTDGRARFEVITPTLIRLEYAADGRFENRPTMTVPRSNRPVPSYSTSVEGGWRVIRTGAVVLRWRRGSGSFDAADLRLRFLDQGRPRVVRPVAGAAHHFLGGWTRALDLQTGPVPLNNGILTRDGWYVLDDSRTALLTPTARGFALRAQRAGAYQDWYAFAYGHDYRGALKDLRVLTGSAPLLPRSAFGVWYSKYYAFSEAELRALAEKFDAENVPLDTLSLDTDYKRVNDPVGAAIASAAVGAPGKDFSWNGWEWNTSLFPDPAAFVRWAHGRGINLAANIHPSIDSRDPQFAAANTAGGGLPASNECKVLQADITGTCHVFDWTDPKQLAAYFALHKPFADAGVDVFWLDWCCENAGGVAGAPGLSPDAWINSRYAAYQRGRGQRWPAFSRIGASYAKDGVYGDRGEGAGTPGALAEHRSTLQFTGDTCATWPMLAFEAELTAAESSIGLPYVSHDIGSFNGTPGPAGCQATTAALTKAALPDDLYVRWLQLGTFQPLDRLHSNHGNRLPWDYDGATRAAATAALRLRGELAPYTYTAARRSVDSGLPIAGPLYLSWPGRNSAYAHPSEFTYGRDLVVAPVTAPGANAPVTLWVPPGDWVEYSTGRRFHGPQVLTMTVPLSRIPVLVRAGAVLPAQASGQATGSAPKSRLVLTAFPGNGTGELYDDAGQGFGYQHGRYTRTTFTQTRKHGTITLRIGGARGTFPGALAARTWDVRLRGVERPGRVTLDGRLLRRTRTTGGRGWSYDPATRTLRVVTGRVSSARGGVVRVG